MSNFVKDAHGNAFAKGNQWEFKNGSKYFNVVGETSGFLTCLRDLEYRDGHRWIECRCACGKIVELRVAFFGRTKSCGCLQRQASVAVGKASKGRESHSKNKPKMDLTGNTYGQLTVIEHVERSKWKVRCSCGTERVVERANLVNGRTKSCGCTRIAFGQEWHQRRAD